MRPGNVGYEPLRKGRREIAEKPHDLANYQAYATLFSALIPSALNTVIGAIGQVRSLLDKRVGDGVRVGAMAGAVRAAKSLLSSSRIALN